MSYEQFMRELEVLLAGVPDEEKEEALQYYADYFADAGKENEEQVLRELESPQKTAALIKAGLKGGGMDGGEFTEWGYTDERFEKRDDLMRQEPKKEKKSGNRYSYQGQEKASYGSYGTGSQTYEKAYNTSYQQKRGPWTNKWLKIVLVVLIILCAFPVVFPTVIAAAAIVVVLVFVGLAIFFGLAVGAAAVVLAGVVVFCAGLSKLIALPSVALLTAGIGLLIFVIGLVATVAAVRLCMMVYPALFRFLVGICSRPFHRKAGV